MNRLASKWRELMNNKPLKKKLYDIIFESETPAGKTFDVVLIIAIIVSILLVVLESFESVSGNFAVALQVMEYLFTFFFTAEYLLRLYCAPNARHYALSFFGIIDLLATLPLYITWIFGPARYLMIVRVFRLIRVFRVFKLFNFLNEGNLLLRALYASSRKIAVFFLFVIIMVISLGTLMYMIEGQQPGTAFNNIPNSIYWACVTLTTVGYGDIAPTTGMGRFLSSIVMLLGYTIIAVPTGIFSASMVEMARKENGLNENDKRGCPQCGKRRHGKDAIFCNHCGAMLEPEES